MDEVLAIWAASQAGELGLTLNTYSIIHAKPYILACTSSRKQLEGITATVFERSSARILAVRGALRRRGDDLVPKCGVLTLVGTERPRFVIVVQDGKGTAYLLQPTLTTDAFDPIPKERKREARFAALGFDAEGVERITRAGTDIYGAAIALRLLNQEQTIEAAILLATTTAAMPPRQQGKLMDGVSLQRRDKALKDAIMLLRQPHLLNL